ncbi:hypothetical protein DJ568_16700 [Mucilaginibacter hurinus]|uniref:IPT/TIG domain-containing protein n=1 Tax=Mucilaginibacter hurinus TaxID=2201324 RepID=A0A367GJM0_9SPHI|nr:IPT/TIG domain-containing protein [Mucilaginibacter hurinus]RCH53674.1 hypothetical protein DJ568_16700 [Mucilaginibacter hurinus]
MNKLFLSLCALSLLFSSKLFAQEPNITVPAKVTFIQNEPISPISITNTGGAVPGRLYPQATPVLTNDGSVNKFVYLSSGDIYGITERQVLHLRTGNIVATLAGSNETGYADGTGGAARFDYLSDITKDEESNLYITELNSKDPFNARIRKVTLAGIVTTFASGLKGAGAIVINSKGSIFISQGTKILRISKSGTQTVFAGQNSPGSIDGVGELASFKHIADLAIDKADNIYVADEEGHKVRKISTDGKVTTLAGSGTPGYADGIGLKATLYAPRSLRVDGNGYVILSSHVGSFRIISPNGAVNTIETHYYNDKNQAIEGRIDELLAIDDDWNIIAGGSFQRRGFYRLITTGYHLPALPKGLSFNSSIAITGTPTELSRNYPTVYRILATNAYGSSSATITINVIVPPKPPVIFSFSPKISHPGGDIIIKGKYFEGVTTVMLGGKRVTGYSVKSGTEDVMTLVVPEGAVSGDITITNPYGTARASGFTVIPPPTITAVSPLSGWKGSKIKITGTNFTNLTYVSFEGWDESFKIISPTEIEFTVGDGASGRILVESPSGQAWYNGFNFIYPPKISSVSPLKAGVGKTVTINGTELNRVTSVKFGTVEASSFKIISPTQLTAVIAAGSGSGITLTGTSGTSTYENFTILPPPTLQDVYPTTAAENGSFNISGYNLDGATVTIGGVAAKLTYTSPYQIFGQVSPGSISGNLVVTTEGGTVTYPNFVVLPKPSIVNFSPKSGAAGDKIIVTVKNLGILYNLSIGGSYSQPRKLSDTTIEITVPQYFATFITLTTDGGTSTVEGFLHKGPGIQSFSPNFASIGQTVSIKGVNFTGITEVSFGGVPATSFSVISDTEIRAVVGQGQTGNILVKNDLGIGFLGNFIHSGPSIFYINPIFGGPLSTKPITISGERFTGVTEVSFGGVPAESFTVSGNTIEAYPAKNSKSGSVIVSSPKGKGTFENFTWVGAPAITSISPTNQGRFGTIIITGTNFIGVTDVKFGGVRAHNFYTNSSTSIQATVAEGASGDVTVTTVGGTATIAGFKYTNPKIDTITPLAAGPGQKVDIIGSDLGNINSVRFGGINASSFTVVSSEKITAVVALNSGDGIEISGTDGGTYYQKFSFISQPRIYSCSPDFGGKDTEITITGQYLLHTTEVAVGGVKADIVSVKENMVIARVGNGKTGSITLKTPGGTAAYNGFNWYAAPTISSISPATAAAGTELTINGTNFTNVYVVQFGETHVAVQPTSSTVIKVTVPEYTGTDTIIVTNFGGNAISTVFKYIRPPVISSFKVSGDGSNATVSVLGRNFSKATEVKFGGVAAASFTIISDTSISAKPGAGATGLISVKGPGGIGTIRGFLYNQPPTLLSFAPAQGPLGSTVIINGDNFNVNPEKNVVYFGPLKAKVKKSSKTQLEIIVPGGGANQFTVTNIENRLTGVSNLPFMVTNTVGKVSFSNKTEIAINANKYAFDDFDNDGNMDLLVLHNDSVSVIKYGTDAVLSRSSFSTRVDLLNGIQISSWVIGDIDGDGKKDILLGIARSVILLRNTSNGSNIAFERTILENIEGQEGLIQLRDMDMDGRPDLIAATDAPVYYPNITTKEGISFGPYVHLPESGGRSFAVTDADGDNKPDVISVADYGRIDLNKNKTVPGNFSATDFVRTQLFIGLGFSPGYFIPADFDGDNKPDLFMSNTWYNYGYLSRNTSLNVAANETIFGTPKKMATPPLVPALSGADIDGDGKIDLLSPSSSSIDYFRNQSTKGNVSFANPTPIISKISNFTNTTARDVDSDGRVDIVTVDFKNKKLVIIHNGPVLKPAITSAQPLLAGTGSRVIITGSHLEGLTAVAFGGKAAQSFKAISADTIVAVVGDGATGTIVIKTLNGEATIDGFTFTKGQSVTYGTADFNPRPDVKGISYTSSDEAVATIIANKIHTAGAGTTTITAKVGTTVIREVLTVKKATLTVTANSVSRTYSESNPDFTLSYNGFVNNDTPEDILQPPAVTTTASITSSAGNYPLNVSGGESPNYIFKYVPGVLTVKPYPSITYGMPDFNPKPGVPGITYTSSNTNVISIVEGKLHIKNAGITTITAKVSGLTFSQALTVKKANLVIKANDKSKTVGTANPILDATYTGFVYNDNIASLTSQPIISTTATTSSPEGTYPITIAGATSNNYNISYTGATLTISKATSRILPTNSLTGILPQPVVQLAVSPNGDGINDYLRITNIDAYPVNKLSIMNSKGVPVFYVENYDNREKVFDGQGLNGQRQPEGTYFYLLEYSVEKQILRKSGYIILKY